MTAVTRTAEDDTVFGPVLDRLAADSSELLGVPWARSPIHSRMIRPFSYIARTTLGVGDQSLSVYIKVTRVANDAEPERIRQLAQRVARDYEVTRNVYGRMPHERGLSVVKPIAVFPDLLAIVTEEAVGETLLRRLERDLPRWRIGRFASLERTLGQAGEWIRAFQSASAVGSGSDAGYVETYIDHRLCRLVSHPAARFSPVDRDAVLTMLRRDAAAVPSDQRVAVPIHADLALANILVDGSRITVLDFAMTAAGAVYHDVTHLYMQLGLLGLKPHYGMRAATRLQDALLEGFGGAPASAPLFRLMLLQHVACHYLTTVSHLGGLASRIYGARVASRHLAWLRSYASGRSMGERT